MTLPTILKRSNSITKPRGEYISFSNLQHCPQAFEQKGEPGTSEVVSKFPAPRKCSGNAGNILSPTAEGLAPIDGTLQGPNSLLTSL